MSSPRTEWLAILNPVAGSGRALKDRARIEALLKAARVPFTLALSEHAGHAVELTAHGAREGYRRFIGIGGDGTLNQLVDGALGAGAIAPGEMTLALIPVGRGNDWARTHAIPRTYSGAVAAIAGGRTHLQDAGLVRFEAGTHAARHFINVAGVGFDAHVVEQTLRGRLGALTYLWGLLRGFVTFQAPHLCVRTADFQAQGKMFLCFAALGRYCGGGMHIAPHAVGDDGLLDVVTVDEVGRGELLLNLRRLFDGTLTSYRKVKSTQAAWVQVESMPAAKVEADGELLGETPVTLSIVPAAVRVVVP
jgi:YegS/Rv2252/BmrU family lipid kinase